MDGPTPDLAYLLPRDSYWQLMHSLHKSLPPPITESPEDLARRNNAAIAQIASLLPVNAAEANVAAEFVAAHAHAMDALREASDPATTPASRRQCRAQATSMMRQAQSALRLLLRLQAIRQKRDANPTEADRAAWTEHCAVGFMSHALVDNQSARADIPPPPAPAPAEAEQPAPAPEPAHPEEPVADLAEEAEQYAIIYPQRAALIRRHGGVPPNVTFGPPREELARVVATGRTPALLALDREPLAARPP